MPGYNGISPPQVHPITLIFRKIPPTFVEHYIHAPSISKPYCFHFLHVFHSYSSHMGILHSYFHIPQLPFHIPTRLHLYLIHVPPILHPYCMHIFFVVSFITHDPYSIHIPSMLLPYSIIFHPCSFPCSS